MHDEQLRVVPAALLKIPLPMVEALASGTSYIPLELKGNPRPHVLYFHRGAGCIVSLMAVVATVACNQTEEDVAVVVGLIGAILGEHRTSPAFAERAALSRGCEQKPCVFHLFDRAK